MCKKGGSVATFLEFVLDGVFITLIDLIQALIPAASWVACRGDLLMTLIFLIAFIPTPITTTLAFSARVRCRLLAAAPASCALRVVRRNQEERFSSGGNYGQKQKRLDDDWKCCDFE